MTVLSHRAFPLVLAAPSGTGKTSIARALVSGPGAFVFSVSATTRSPRRQEKDGADYHFVSTDEFRRMIDAGDLVEWAEVHGHLYGTPRAAIDGPLESGHDVVLDIDVQGARQVRETLDDAVLVFVFPPSAAALVSRLSGRATEAPEIATRRLENARDELAAAEGFDYVVVNETLAEAVDAVRGIVHAERHRRSRTGNLGAEIARLQQEIDELIGNTTATDREV